MKLGAYTVKLTDVLAVWLPEVPVTIRLYCPTAAVAVAVSVRVLEPLERDAGAKAAVTPLGRPVTERCTMLLNPFWGLRVTVEVAEPAWPIETLE